MSHFISPMPSPEFLWDIFKKIDGDSNGCISPDELQMALTNGTWIAFNSETIRLLVGMFDKHNRGEVSFGEFCAMWKYVTDWQNCFLSFDRENCGNMNQSELSQALAGLGYRLSPNIVRCLICKFDRFSKGAMLFEDFVQCCVKLYTYTAAFRNYDIDLDGIIQIHYEQFLHILFNLKV